MKYNYQKLSIKLAKVVIVVFIFCLPKLSSAQSTFKTAAYNGKQLLIHTSNGYIAVVPYSSNVIQVTYQQQAINNLKSYSVVAGSQVVKTTYKDEGSTVKLTTSGLQIVVDKADLAIHFTDKKGEAISSAKNYTPNGEGFKLDFVLNNDEAIYGGGSRAINLNKRGQVLENYNQAHGGYKFGQVDLNIAIPFLVSSIDDITDKHLCLRINPRQIVLYAGENDITKMKKLRTLFWTERCVFTI